MENSRDKMTMFNVHVLEPVSLLLAVQLIKQGLFQVHPLDIQNHDQTFIVALVAQHVKHVSSGIVNVNFLVNDIRRCSQIRHQVQNDVFEPKIAVEN
jgi:hypothetical protein